MVAEIIVTKGEIAFKQTERSFVTMISNTHNLICIFTKKKKRKKHMYRTVFFNQKGDTNEIVLYP
jgi:hypothetical protein